MRVVSLEIHGYRCLGSVALALRSPMVMIGPNGSGKTALLEVFTLLRAAAREQLGEALADRGGIHDVLVAGGSGVAGDQGRRRRGRPAGDHRLPGDRAERCRPRHHVGDAHAAARSDELSPHLYIQNYPGHRRHFDPNSKKLELRPGSTRSWRRRSGRSRGWSTSPPSSAGCCTRRCFTTPSTSRNGVS